MLGKRMQRATRMQLIKTVAADACDLSLICYLIENHEMISRYPVCGNLETLFLLFCETLSEKIDFNDKSLGKQRYASFKHELTKILEIEPDCFQIDANPIEGDKLLNVDAHLLDVLFSQLNKDLGDDIYVDSNMTFSSVRNTQTGEHKFDKEQMQKTLFSVLDMNTSSVLDDKDLGEDFFLQRTSPQAALYYSFTHLLQKETAFKTLYKEKLLASGEPKKFIPVCSNTEHLMLLLKYIKIENNKIVSLGDFDRVSMHKNELLQSALNCFKTHIHYVPNLKPHTDPNLGDCSYLDTCHKQNSCRYIHYIQYAPFSSLLTEVVPPTAKSDYNTHIQDVIPLFTHGDSIKMNPLVPKQWIKCDVRNFDFNILGKFSCVIADPAWNIHMNLPYGTCNDNELLQMPLDLLQDEGIFFLWVTGRSVELGKESLKKWGYEVVTGMSWIKLNQLGRTIVTGRTGHWLNHSKEHLLVGVKGSPQWLNKQQDIDLIVSHTRETSRKPDELYGICERLCGRNSRKLEIFGRDHNVRPGWFTIGNQLQDSCIHEMDVKTKYDRWALQTHQRPNGSRKNKKHEAGAGERNHFNKPSSSRGRRIRSEASSRA